MSETIIDEFCIEAIELLEMAENAFLDLGKSQDLQNSYNQIFRAFHSLKGAAGMMGLIDLQNHMHLLESQFDKLKNNLDKIDAQTDYFLLGIDASHEILKGKKVDFDYSQGDTDTNQKISDTATAKGENTLYLLMRDRDLISFIKAQVGPRLNSKVFDNASTLNEFLKINESAPIFSEPCFEEALDSFPQLKKMNVLYFSLNDGALSSVGRKDLISLVYDLAKENIDLHSMVNTSFSLMMYQFSDLCEYLEKSNKKNILEMLRSEIGRLMEKRQDLIRGR